MANFDYNKYNFCFEQLKYKKASYIDVAIRVSETILGDVAIVISVTRNSYKYLKQKRLCESNQDLY